MMFSWKLQFCVALKLIAANYAEPEYYDCPDVPSVEHFDKARFAGKWAEIAGSTHDCILDTCVYYDFQYESGDEFLYVRGFRPSSDTGASFYINRTTIDANGKGHWDGHDFSIIATDYETYAVLYACSFDYLDWHYKNEIWILMRGEPTDGTTKKISNLFDEHHIDTGNVMKVDQVGCDDLLDNFYKISN